MRLWILAASDPTSPPAPPLQGEGCLLGIIDAIIGECAVGLGATLVTFNVRHFQAIPGLVTEQPYARR